MTARKKSASRPDSDKELARHALASIDEQRRLYLSTVALKAPQKGNSWEWRFSVENLLGWTMAEVTVWFEVKRDAPCVVLDENWGAKGQWTAPTVRIEGPEVDVTRIERKSKECDEGVMDGVRFQVSVTFDGYINNVPYRNYFEVWADGTTDYGPK